MSDATNFLDEISERLEFDKTKREELYATFQGLDENQVASRFRFYVEGLQRAFEATGCTAVEFLDLEDEVFSGKEKRLESLEERDAFLLSAAFVDRGHMAFLDELAYRLQTPLEREAFRLAAAFADPKHRDFWITTKKP